MAGQLSAPRTKTRLSPESRSVAKATLASSVSESAPTSTPSPGQNYEETHAFSQYVLPEEDLEVKVSSFFSKIKEPVLTNPNLKFTGDVHTTKLYPSPLPDLFKGEQTRPRRPL